MVGVKQIGNSILAGSETMGFDDDSKTNGKSTSWNLNEIFEILNIFDDLEISVNPSKDEIDLKIVGFF